MNKKAFKKDIKEIIKTMNYVEALERGLIDYDNILDYIDAWHESDSELEIDEYLGMTEEQYFEYLRNHERGLRKMFKKCELN